MSSLFASIKYHILVERNGSCSNCLGGSPSVLRDALLRSVAVFDHGNSFEYSRAVFSYLLYGLIFSLSINVTLFLGAYAFKTDKLTDGAYALSFIALTLYSLFTEKLTASRLVLGMLITLWALRLGFFLVIRIIKNRRDKRFDTWRNSFWLLGRFWILQAITAWVVLVPTLIALSRPNLTFTTASITGIIIWATALIIETVADFQKYRFNSQVSNKGKWIDSGLWQYSRHPNYFGEIFIWIGIYCALVPLLSGWERLLGIVSPMFITSILIFFTGIPILEKQADEKWSKDKGYRYYKLHTSILIPWFRKSS